MDKMNDEIEFKIEGKDMAKKDLFGKSGSFESFSIFFEEKKSELKNYRKKKKILSCVLKILIS